MRAPRLRMLLVVSTVAVGSIAAIGVLHLPIARPLLARLGVSCPVDTVSAVQVDRMHQAATHALRGTAPAPGRGVFGLTVFSSTEADVQRWADARHVACTPAVRGMRDLSCANVPSAALGADAAGAAIADLTFSFTSRGTLVGVDTLRGGLSDREGAALGASIAQRLRGEAGDPMEQAGRFEAPYLHDGAYRTSYVRYRFADYLVTVTAVQMPGRGVTVRELYVGVGDQASS